MEEAISMPGIEDSLDGVILDHGNVLNIENTRD